MVPKRDADGQKVRDADGKVVKEPGPEREAVRVWGVHSLTKQWAPYTLYGGLVLENIVQGASRDVMQAGMHALAEAGWNPVLDCHDEIVCDVRPELASVDRMMELLAAAKPAWADRLPVATECWINTSYRK